METKTSAEQFNDEWADELAAIGEKLASTNIRAEYLRGGNAKVVGKLAGIRATMDDFHGRVPLVTMKCGPNEIARAFKVRRFAVNDDATIVTLYPL